MGWPGIAVPPGMAHFPTNLYVQRKEGLVKLYYSKTYTIDNKERPSHPIRKKEYLSKHTTPVVRDINV